MKLRAISGIGVVAAIVGVVGVSSVASAVMPEGVRLSASAATRINSGAGQVSDRGPNLESILKRVVNAMLFLLGSIAVIAIVIGGIRYATSNGDPSNVKAAKDTILYAAIGLVAAIAAYAIVNWVARAFGG